MLVDVVSTLRVSIFSSPFFSVISSSKEPPLFGVSRCQEVTKKGVVTDEADIGELLSPLFIYVIRRYDKYALLFCRRLVFVRRCLSLLWLYVLSVGSVIAVKDVTSRGIVGGERHRKTRAKRYI
jgi:hypothetical protein